MENFITISALYTPVQPSVKPLSDGLSYREGTPDHRLSGYIHCYWELKTTRKLEESFRYRVVADGCIDVYVALSRPEESYVAGFQKNYTEFPLGTTFHYIGIRFYPAMFPLLFHTGASELTGRYELLQSVVPDLAAYLKKYLNSNLNTGAIRTLLDRYFLKWIAGNRLNPDLRFFNALGLVLQNSGSLRVQTGLDTGISPRQLRRLFEFYVGDTTKSFCKVVRFQKLLHGNRIPANNAGSSFLDYGYYDQSHFIKEFKQLYGLTPKSAFSK